MDFVFDIRKAVAATGYLCSLNGGRLNVLHLIKMLYVADRTALLQWRRTITGDKFVSMEHGPVLSKIYDLMCGRGNPNLKKVWNTVFKPRDGNIIALTGLALDFGPLSKRELDALAFAFKEFKDIPAGKLIDFLHAILPEWKNPGGSSVPIDPKKILSDSGCSAEEIAEWEEEIDFAQSAKVALQR